MGGQGAQNLTTLWIEWEVRTRMEGCEQALSGSQLLKSKKAAIAKVKVTQLSPTKKLLGQCSPRNL